MIFSRMFQEAGQARDRKPAAVVAKSGMLNDSSKAEPCQARCQDV